MNQNESAYPRRLKLALTPTPLEPLERVSRKLGPEILIKRDDLTGAEVSGNKIRKLEFLLAEALDQGTRTVITCGGAQSNHARATAAACARLGLGCRLVLRVPDPKDPPPPSANILLDRILGAEIVWISPTEYDDRVRIMAREADELAKEGRKAYIIPEGGSVPLGSLGYVRAVEELAGDLAKLPGGTDQPLTIVAATGSGGTLAGLSLGVKLLGLPARVVGINVAADKEYYLAEVGRICAGAAGNYNLGVEIEPGRDFEIMDGYVGLGYAVSRVEELALIRDLARLEGVILDPVYTGKAFFGLRAELKRNPEAFGPRIVFFHTGGLTGLFPKAGQLREVLGEPVAGQ
jgi:D-cysteine desulfhydrase